MLPKLIQTNYTYTYRYDWDGGVGKVQTVRGSYLGRKEASERTIREFLRDTTKNCPFVLLSVNIEGPHVSQYIHA